MAANERPRKDLAPEDGYRVGDWWVKPRLHRIDRHGERRHLEPRLVGLLQFFVDHAGDVVSKEEILDGVWKTRHVADSALTRSVAELRRALGDDAQSPSYIETIPKRGYRLVAEVGLEAPAGPSSRPLRWAFLAASVLVALVVGGVVAADWLQRLRREEAGSVEADRHAIAVLPLVDLSEEPDEEYFAESMTEALITDLARISGLQVTSRRSVERFRESDASTAEIAAALNVDTLVEGTVLRAEGKVRISVRIIDALADQNLWGASFERQLRDVLQLQNEIAAAIVRQIHVSLGEAGSRLADRPPRVDPEAHDLYLRGRYFLNRLPLGEPASSAIRFFDAAIALDPDYAPAYAGRADYYNLSCAIGISDPREGYPKAKEAALEALELDPDLAAAHAALGTASFRHDWDWRTAEAHYETALELNPSDALVHRQYGHFLTCLGRNEEAIEHGRRAVQLDPLTEKLHNELGWLLWNAGRYEESARILSRPVQAERAAFQAALYLAWNYAVAGRYDAAIRDLRRLQEGKVHHEDLLAGTLAWTLGRAGRLAEGTAILERLEQEYRAGEGNPYALAIAATGLGREEEAIDWLELAVEERTPSVVYARNEPFFGPLQSNPRLRTVLQGLGF